MKKRFAGELIIEFLKEAEAGVPVKERCRQHGFSDASLSVQGTATYELVYS